MKITVKWSTGDQGNGPLLKWYDGPKWKWLLWWKWFGYAHLWRGYIHNRGNFRGRFVATLDEALTKRVADDIAEEIDQQILAALANEEDK